MSVLTKVANKGSPYPTLVAQRLIELEEDFEEEEVNGRMQW